MSDDDGIYSRTKRNRWDRRVVMTVIDIVKHGSVVWFSAQKGFGFVLDRSTGDEYFTHFSAIQSDGYKTLKENDEVEFTVEKGPKGKLQAANVRIVK